MPWNISPPAHGPGGTRPAPCSEHTTLTRMLWPATSVTSPNPGGSGCGLKARLLTVRPPTTSSAPAAAAMTVFDDTPVTRNRSISTPPRSRDYDGGGVVKSLTASETFVNFPNSMDSEQKLQVVSFDRFVVDSGRRLLL